MFLQHLTEEQKRKVLVLAHKLTMADGEDATDEEQALAALKAEFGIRETIPMHEILADLDSCVGAFDSALARRAAVMQVLLLAFTDEYLHPAESDFLGTLAGKMGLSQEAFDPLVQWAYRYGQASRAGDTAAQESLAAEAETLLSKEGEA